MADSAFEDYFQDAVKPGPGRLASGFTFAAVNEDGTKKVHKAYGTTTIAGSEPFSEDAFIWIASCTKLATLVATLQCVEKGLFSLDDADELASILPELSKPEVIQSFDIEKKKVDLRPAAERITLRKLLNHTNGLGYDAVQPGLMAWRASRGEDFKWLCGDIKEAYATPLVAEPGAAWNYSPGFDWAGQMIERKTSQRLGQYMSTHIFEPLGMNKTTFDEDTRSDLTLVPSTVRKSPDGPLEDGWLPDHHKTHCKDHCGGAGLYSTASDYLSLLSAVLRQDKNLLSPASYNLMFHGSLDPSVKAGLNGALALPFLRPVFAPGLPDGVKYDYTVGTMIFDEDVPGFAHKGSIMWVGVCNQFWLIDREAGYCAVYLQQLHPSGDPASDALRRKVREYLWSEFAKK